MLITDVPDRLTRKEATAQGGLASLGKALLLGGLLLLALFGLIYSLNRLVGQ